MHRNSSSNNKVFMWDIFKICPLTNDRNDEKISFKDTDSRHFQIFDINIHICPRRLWIFVFKSIVNIRNMKCKYPILIHEDFGISLDIIFKFLQYTKYPRNLSLKNLKMQKILLQIARGSPAHTALLYLLFSPASPAVDQH